MSPKETKGMSVIACMTPLSVREFITVSYSLLFVHMLIYVQSLQYVKQQQQQQHDIINKMMTDILNHVKTNVG